MSGRDSSPEKRAWKVVQKKDKGPSKGKAKGKNTSKGKGKAKGTSGTRYADVERMRSGEERWEEVLRRASEANVLLEPTGFYRIIEHWTII